jgi:hypothetical protein
MRQSLSDDFVDFSSYCGVDQVRLRQNCVCGAMPDLAPEARASNEDLLLAWVRSVEVRSLN